MKYPVNFTSFDLFTRERRIWLDSISGLRKNEKPKYAIYWMLALIFGVRMPHERRREIA